MPTLTKNKKIIIGLASVFLVLGVVFIFAAPSAKADIFGIGTIAGNAIMSVLAWVAYAILWFFSRLISVAAFLLQAVFTIEDSTGFTKVTIVTTGWQITRGLCNMFFALILLLMAFDTILQINKFPIKTVLPKLILVALTINFSLVFLGVIIDFAQILTRYFIDAAGGPSHSIADQLANGLNIAKVFQTPTSQLDTGQNIRSVLGGGTASLLTIFGTLAFGIAVILIAFFTIAVGAIFMLIRLVSLWVLLITAPLAWLAMVAPLPGLSSITGDWWKKFFQWTFFAPIYAFFIYLAVLTSTAGGGIKGQFTVTAGDATNATVSQIFPANSFLANGIGSMLQYIVIIIILLTGLKTAQSSGLAGAGAVMAWGKKAGDKLKSGAKRWSGAQWAYDAAKEKGVKLAGGAVSTLGFERFGRRIKAKGVAMETKPEEREQHKAYANNIKTMSDLDLQEEVKHAYGIRKLLAARQAKERGLLDKTEDTVVVKKAMATFGAYGVKDDKGKTKEQRDLEDVRFDTIDNDKDGTDTARRATIRRSKENGALDKIKPVILKNAKAFDSFCGELDGPGELEEQFKKMGKMAKKTFEEEMLKAIQGARFSDSNDETRKRETFASVTGQVGSAFGADAKGVITEPAQMMKLASYIGKMTAASVAKINHPEKAKDLKLVAQNAKPELIISFGRERSASAEQKGIFYNETLAEAIKKGDQKILTALKSPGWSAFSGIKSTREQREEEEENEEGTPPMAPMA